MWVNTNASTQVDRVQVAPAAVQRVLPSVSVGAVLNVLVARELQSGTYELLLGNQLLKASSSQSLAVGQRYNLQVAGFEKSGQVMLRPALELPSPLQAAIHQRLTAQMDPGRLLQALFTLVQTGAPLAQSSEMSSLVANFAKRRDITDPKRLTEKIQNSGLFSEHLAGTGGNKPAPDFKQALAQMSGWLAARAMQKGAEMREKEGELRVSGGAAPSSSRAPYSTEPYVATPQSASSVYRRVKSGDNRPFPFSFSSRMTETLDLESISGLKRAVDGAISRIEAQQLLLVQAQNQQQTSMLFDIPVMDRNQLSTWNFHIRDEANDLTDNEREKVWTVVLAVDLPAVGPLSIQLRHSHGATGITFYSEHAPVCRLIDQAAENFTQRLADLGFSGVDVSSHLGNLPENQEPEITYPHLSEKA